VDVTYAPRMPVTHGVHILGPMVPGTMGSCQDQLVDEDKTVQANGIMIASTNTQYTWTYKFRTHRLLHNFVT
jgi:hypothetical protein